MLDERLNTPETQVPHSEVYPNRCTNPSCTNPNCTGNRLIRSKDQFYSLVTTTVSNLAAKDAAFARPPFQPTDLPLQLENDQQAADDDAEADEVQAVSVGAPECSAAAAEVSRRQGHRSCCRLTAAPSSHKSCSCCCC